MFPVRVAILATSCLVVQLNYFGAILDRWSGNSFNAPSDTARNNMNSVLTVWSVFTAVAGMGLILLLFSVFWRFMIQGTRWRYTKLQKTMRQLDGGATVWSSNPLRPDPPSDEEDEAAPEVTAVIEYRAHELDITGDGTEMWISPTGNTLDPAYTGMKLPTALPPL